MSSGNSPPPPDYTPIAQANKEAAEANLKLGTDQLNWAKEQYKDTAPYTKAYLDSTTKASNQAFQNATEDRARYKSVYQPVEDDFVKKAMNWDNPARAEEQAGAAKADVSASFDAAREASTRQLEGFGIDPSQTRFGALDLASRVSKAAAMSAAGTQSRQNTAATGLGLEGEAINIGKGYPGQVAQSYATGTTAGGAGITSALNTSSTYGNLMGTPVQYGNLAQNNLNGATSALNTGYTNAIAGHQLDVQSSNNTSSGIGALAGAAMTAAAIY